MVMNSLRPFIRHVLLAYRNRGCDEENTTFRVRIECRQSCLEQMKAALDINRPTLVQ
jgi:methyl coenzyme M reductase gamma subunit